jgi:PadR family transcriptional regulator PadR
MIFTLNAAMLDFLVLSIIHRGDSYGYQISQMLKPISNAKDSTLYPVLKRLTESGWVEAYDQPYQGRNRRYYRITDAGCVHQEELCEEWAQFAREVENIVEGGKTNEQ